MTLWSVSAAVRVNCGVQKTTVELVRLAFYRRVLFVSLTAEARSTYASAASSLPACSDVSNNNNTMILIRINGIVFIVIIFVIINNSYRKHNKSFFFRKSEAVACFSSEFDCKNRLLRWRSDTSSDTMCYWTPQN